jgi:hypothetical protein
MNAVLILLAENVFAGKNTGSAPGDKRVKKLGE